MNLTYFLDHYPGKHKLVAHDEMLEMAARGHHINIVAFHGEKPINLPFFVYYLQNKTSYGGLIRQLLCRPVKSLKHLFLLKKHMGYREAIKYFSQYHRLGFPDHVHAHFANQAALKGMLFSKYHNIPFSCTGHGSDLLLYPKEYLPDLIKNSSPFITISHYNQKYLAEKYRLDTSGIKINYCGVDVDYYKASSESQPDIFTITSVTALKPVKGVEYLVEACRLLNTQKTDFICHIIGGGPDYEKIQTRINAYNLNDKVILQGRKSQTEIKRFLDNSTIFVLPSVSEGIPVAVMEAMAMNLPVVATKITGLPEIIENGKNGFLVGPRNVQELAEKIELLYREPELCNQFSANARQIIEQKFNLKSNVTRFEQLISGGTN